ncbi:hypothetical protein F8M41_007676 [Gigaspora margarita]|uniref:Uncharacterized protein n=1 Tax=Gigaspora margarita TaxID=4874 RepID=A0A8H3X602_GIGMA|nr:hypothetical protein F8M41_007676 [Gigaspora margarita]
MLVVFYSDLGKKTVKKFSTDQKPIAISGLQWSNKELEYFRIETVNVEDFEKFFQKSSSKIENLSDQVKEVLSTDLSKVDILSKELKLEMCGSRIYTKPNMCIETSRLVIKLLVQENKSYKVSNQDNDAKSQSFAKAIASF